MSCLVLRRWLLSWEAGSRFREHRKDREQRAEVVLQEAVQDPRQEAAQEGL